MRKYFSVAAIQPDDRNFNFCNRKQHAYPLSRHSSLLKFMMSTLVGNDHKAVAGGIVVKEAHRVDLDTIAPLFDAYR